jgi:hypothetical protein
MLMSRDMPLQNLDVLGDVRRKHDARRRMRRWFVQDRRSALNLFIIAVAIAETSPFLRAAAGSGCVWGGVQGWLYVLAF